MGSKVVPQRAQNTIKADIARMLNDSAEYESYEFDEKSGNILVNNEYEVIMVVIPAQSSHHSEVRNG